VTQDTRPRNARDDVASTIQQSLEGGGVDKMAFAAYLDEVLPVMARPDTPPLFVSTGAIFETETNQRVPRQVLTLS
jgi:hypothetical protein